MTIGDIASSPLLLLLGGVFGITAIIVVIGIVKVGFQELRNDFRGSDGRGVGGEYDESPDLSGPVDDGRSNEDAVQLGVDKDDVSEAVREASPDDEVGVGGGLNANTYNPDHVESDKDAALEKSTPDGLSAGQSTDDVNTDSTNNNESESPVSEPDIDRSDSVDDDMIPDSTAIDSDTSSTSDSSQSQSTATDTGTASSGTAGGNDITPPDTNQTNTGGEFLDDVNTGDSTTRKSSSNESEESREELSGEPDEFRRESDEIFEDADGILSDE